MDEAMMKFKRGSTGLPTLWDGVSSYCLILDETGKTPRGILSAYEPTKPLTRCIRFDILSCDPKAVLRGIAAMPQCLDAQVFLSTLKNHGFISHIVCED